LTACAGVSSQERPEDGSTPATADQDTPAGEDRPRKEMLMLMRVDKEDFIRIFSKSHSDRFTDEALGATFDYFGGWQDTTSWKQMAIDLIGICATFAEHASMGEALEAYDVGTEEELERKVAVLIPLPSGRVVVQSEAAPGQSRTAMGSSPRYR